ncbi:helix-turn-helix domain-containing protein [Acinetobacter baumannii]
MNSKSPIFTAQSDVALRIHVDRAVRHYFAQLQGEQPSQVYDMVLAEMEKPLLSVVLEYTRGNQTRAAEYTRGNQTRAAEILGLNRGTLRKKLKAHGLMSE